MSFYYYKGKRVINIDGVKEDRYVAVNHVMGTKNEKDIAKKLSKSLSMEGPEVLLMLDELADQIVDAVLSGQTVKMDGLGTFTPSLRTRGSAKIDDVAADNIKKVNINFRLESSFKKEVDNVSVRYFKEIDANRN